MILVVGATGKLCSRLARGLLQAGSEVCVLVSHRPPLYALAGHEPVSMVHSLAGAGARPMWGDMSNRASLRRALEGAEAVIAITDGKMTWGEDAIEPPAQQDIWNLIDEAQRAGVRRFMLASIPGANFNPDEGPTRAGLQLELVLRRSGMVYTAIRPSILMEGWIGSMVGIPMMTEQTVMLIGRGDHAHNFISELDLADYCVAMLNHPEAFNKTLAIGGPASHTWTEIVDEMRSRVGADLPVQYALPGSPIPYVPEPVSELVSELELFEDYLDISDASRTFGVRPTSLGTYIDRTFATTPGLEYLPGA